MASGISARTVLCGILLHPAGHTRSPAMHNAAFRKLGIDAVYTAFDVPPHALAAALAGARNHHLDAALLGIGQVVRQPLRRSVRRDHAGVAGDPQLLQGLLGDLHHIPVALAPHNHGDPRVRYRHYFVVCHGELCAQPLLADSRETPNTIKKLPITTSSVVTA